MPNTIVFCGSDNKATDVVVTTNLDHVARREANIYLYYKNRDSVLTLKCDSPEAAEAVLRHINAMIVR